MDDNSTIVITDIRSALDSDRQEVGQKPAALVVVGGENSGTLFNLTEQTTTVGRSADSTIVLDFNGISRCHFTIKFTTEGPVIEDAGSKNGTYINNKRIESPTALSKGDIIKLGNTSLKYIPKNDPDRLAYDKLQWEADRDGHTGCYNKTYFNGALELHAKKSKIMDTPLSLVVFDLDHFKNVNDTYGHDAGDFVLKELASIVRAKGIRGDDIFARYGGEEFVILLPKTNLRQAIAMAKRLRKLIEGHDFLYEEKTLPVTASIGVSEYNKDMETASELFKLADAAVYQAKESGRNNVQCVQN